MRSTAGFGLKGLLLYLALAAVVGMMSALWIYRGNAENQWLRTQNEKICEARIKEDLVSVQCGYGNSNLQSACEADRRAAEDSLGMTLDEIIREQFDLEVEREDSLARWGRSVTVPVDCSDS